MVSDNPSGADNQQETQGSALDPNWVCGFVDGEGCFSVSIHRHPGARKTNGWQMQAVFQVYQHERDRETLERIRRFFGCGAVRPKGPKSSVLTYAVWSMADLAGRVIPFFEAHHLIVKDRDFKRFACIVRAMRRKEHLDPQGFERLARLAYSMNGVGKQRARTLDEILGGSSETVRQAPSVG
jgi:LAGLIDADG endonuclease